MLLQSLEESRRTSVLPFIKLVAPYSKKLKRKGMPPLSKEIQAYQSDVLLKIHMPKVINLYFALSVATLHRMNNEYHSNPTFKYERCITPHEDLIYRILTLDHDLPVVRQLLIGGNHADLYIPTLHWCIEPSSERYFSTPWRASSEALTDSERVKMNHLWVWRTESFKTTKKDVDSFVQNQLMTRPSLTGLEIQNNFFTMACHTIPQFIPYKSFCLLIKENKSTLRTPI